MKAELVDAIKEIQEVSKTIKLLAEELEKSTVKLTNIQSVTSLKSESQIGKDLVVSASKVNTLIKTINRLRNNINNL